ncbi:GNAT family N-acetyltransferase [Rummeliibacillus stabekisii]|uniref:GNAT family acetyltransferase n=1 Tax=Rummeliibacillus stabekisii TaxID=241244 RepID=A0A143HF15_9BACL|nr:GNAT family N-acetyltransferase [Rummeliibacillus stabekisii]AMX00323.1 GNAT family acetyltransferase [Rummeliibacillus stabekisii]
MELQTERLIITPCTKELLQEFSKTEEYIIGLHVDLYLLALKDDPSLSGWGVWLVINKEDHTIIGDMGFKGKPNSQKTVEVGYAIIPSAQKKGYATEAVKEIINWAFSTGKVDKVVAECLHDNHSSIRVLEKLQMKRTEPKNNMLNWELEKS